LKSKPNLDASCDAPRTTGSTYPDPDTSQHGTSSQATRSLRLSGQHPWDCELCGKTFHRDAAEVRKGVKQGRTGLYCGRACSNASRKTDRACRTCGSQVPRKGLLYCTEQCRTVRYQVDVTCAQCDTRFTLSKADHRKRVAQLTGDRPLVCSKRCLGDMYTKERGRRCKGCGNPVERTDRRGSWYCTDPCREQNWRRLAKTPDLSGGRPGRRTLEEKPCQACGLLFRPRSSRQEYCTRDCSNAAHSIRMVGIKNPKYTRGTSYAKCFRTMRPIVLNRDNRRCVVCDAPESFKTVTRLGKEQKRSTFHVHHINEDPSDNRPQNLITLCDNCHAVHHKSAQTPFPWFAGYAEKKSASMTSRWKAQVTSLLAKYSSTTA
jgi:hypothetical protein